MPEKAFIHPRTAAFHVKEPGKVQKFHFWTIDPGWNEPGFYIREHQVETSGYGSSSMRITEKLDERAAYSKLAELERAAAAKYPLADDTEKPALERLGDNYFKNAKPFRDCFTQSMREDNLATLRNRRKNANLNLKPK